MAFPFRAASEFFDPFMWRKFITQVQGSKALLPDALQFSQGVSPDTSLPIPGLGGPGRAGSVFNLPPLGPRVPQHGLGGRPSFGPQFTSPVRETLGNVSFREALGERIAKYPEGDVFATLRRGNVRPLMSDPDMYLSWAPQRSPSPEHVRRGIAGQMGQHEEFSLFKFDRAEKIPTGHWKLEMGDPDMSGTWSVHLSPPRFNFGREEKLSPSVIREVMQEIGKVVPGVVAFRGFRPPIGVRKGGEDIMRGPLWDRMSRAWGFPPPSPGRLR